MQQSEGKKEQVSFKRHGHCVHLNASAEVTKAQQDPQLDEQAVSNHCDSPHRAPLPDSALKDPSEASWERLLGDTCVCGCCWRASKMPEYLCTEDPFPAALGSAYSCWSLVEHTKPSFPASEPLPSSLFCRQTSTQLLTLPFISQHPDHCDTPDLTRSQSTS